METQLIFTDRSSRELDFFCPRAGFFNRFYWNGPDHPSGLSLAKGDIHLQMGSGTHLGVQALLRGAGLAEALEAAKGLLTLEDKDFRSSYGYQEATDLLEALITVWYKHRLGPLLQEYRVLAIEPDLSVELYSDDLYRVVLKSKPDVILQRISDGRLLQWELKTKGTIQANWVRSWEHNMQLTGQTLALREWGRKNGFEEGVGVGGMVEAIVKGFRKRDSDGQERFTSNLIWAYFDPKEQASPAWSWKKNWTKGLISGLGKGALSQWILETLPAEETVGKCIVVPVLEPSEWELDKAKRQWGQGIIQNQIKASLLSESIAIHSEPEEEALDCYFPQNTEGCFRYGKCRFYDLCWTPSVSADPLGSGLYKIREPHHNESLED